MAKTNHFQLDYLEPQQLTSQDVLEDQRRFTTIDNNLFALFKIFGNGILVLESTEFPLYVELFTDSNAVKKIKITPGRAFVNFKSINYTTVTVLDLPTQSGSESSQKFFLYLKDTGNTTQTEIGEFIFSSAKLPVSDAYIGLGAIQVNYTSSTAQFFDDSDNGREILNIKKLFLDFINEHTHTGGLGNPKKIDLGKETIGQLSPDAITFVNASKIRGGQISQFVYPQINHNKLQNSGNLSHSQIDSAVLSFRKNLNLEIIASLNQIQTIGSIIRTSAENTVFTGSAAFPSGPIATIDNGLSNIFVYVPNITTDGFIVGISGPAETNLPNITTNATGPTYAITSEDKIANIDRINKYISITNSPMSDANIQKVFTLQEINPQEKINQYGQNGYFSGFIAGLRSSENSGSTHLIHALFGTSGPSTDVLENFEQYTLTLKNTYNSAGPYGFSGVQISALLTHLPDFSPTNIYNDDTFSHLVYSGQFTGPRILSAYHNGYIGNLTPSAFFATTGPLGLVRSFYYQSATGSKAVLFNDGTLVADLGASDYSISTLGNGKLHNINSKVVLSEFSTNTLKLTEIGPVGPIQEFNITSNATNITQSVVQNFEDENNYRAFYIDNNRLYLATQDEIVQLGYFPNVVDLSVKNNKLYILTHDSGTQKLYYAYQSGYPTVFNQIIMPTANPSGSVLDSFLQSSNNQDYINIVSDNNYYVFDLAGRIIFNYKPGGTNSSGPIISSIYTQFDLGDATVDLKYG